VPACSGYTGVGGSAVISGVPSNARQCLEIILTDVLISKGAIFSMKIF